MKKTAPQVLLWPIAALAIVATPVTVLVGAVWDRITCKKATVVSDTLYVKGVAVDATQIEALTVHVYPVGSTFKLKLRSARPIGLLPACGRDLVAWAKNRGISVVLEGEKWARRRFE